MKSKTKVVILFALVIIFLFSGIFISRFSKEVTSKNIYFEFNEKGQIQIRQSGFWNLTGNPIYIDGLATGVGAHNWTWAETQPWCSGSGSWADPYLIENDTIDGQGSGNCIEIENSDAYFIIRNCSLYNSGSTSDNAGLKLRNVNNGKIMNSNCSNNIYNGIYLRSSDNNTLLTNIVNNNKNGIFLYWLNFNNTLSTNTVNNNKIGINLYDSDNNTLSGNTANNNENGIFLSSSNNNMLLENNARDNEENGIDLNFSNDTTLSGNIASNNLNHGINLGYCNSTTLLGNNASKNITGISIGNSNYNTLLGNTANNIYYGIFLGFSNGNTLSGNTVSNNNEVGITLYDGSDNNSLFGNTLDNNTKGIWIWNSNNNTLLGNLMNFCGISLEGSLIVMSSQSIDTSNLVNSKPVYYYINELGLGADNFTNPGQIIMINCDDSIISGLNVSGGSGIFLGYCNNNTLSENTIINNLYGIKLDSNSINNKIFLNYFINNEINAEDNGINNIWDNGVNGNYWDDYEGVDENDDSIGDTPHTISGTAGSRDNFPIWDDGDEVSDGAPVISFGNYYMFFTILTLAIFSLIILEKQKKK